MKTPLTDELQGFPLATKIHTLHIANLVAEEVEVPRSSDTRVFLAQRTGSRVTRVGKQAIIRHGFVQLLEAFDRHVNFAAHFHFVRDTLAAQSLGDAANGAYIGRPILTDQPVSTRCAD